MGDTSDQRHDCPVHHNPWLPLMAQRPRGGQEPRDQGINCTIRLAQQIELHSLKVAAMKSPIAYPSMFPGMVLSLFLLPSATILCS
jgi:hypothetical protein